MNKSVQMAWRSRLTAAVGVGLAVAAAACSGNASSATSPSSVTPSSLEANGQPSGPNPGEDTRKFSVTLAPTSVPMGDATLQVTVTRDATSGKSQKLGSAEIYLPDGLIIQSVSNFSNPNWTSGVSGQTVRVGANAGNQKLDGSTERTSVTFDIKVTPTGCATYPFTTAQASNATFADAFDPNWIYLGTPLSVTVTGCPAQECKAAPAVANEYLDSIGFTGGGPGGIKRGDIISAVADNMTQGARFDAIDKCSAASRAAVIAFVDALLPPKV
jgi:hypothetical protein